MEMLEEEEAPRRKITLARSSSESSAENGNIPPINLQHAPPSAAVTNVTLHNQLKNLKPPKSDSMRRPSLSVRRELTPIRAQ